MKSRFFLCVLFYCIASVYCQIELNSFEQECITSIGVSRDLVLQDKRLDNGPSINVRRNTPTTVDSKFNDYLGCYAEKLSETGNLAFTKNVFVKLPGYRTRYEIKSLYCNDEDDREPLRPCVQKVSL